MLFRVIVTDRGIEFTDPMKAEADPEIGEIQCRVFDLVTYFIKSWCSIAPIGVAICAYFDKVKLKLNGTNKQQYNKQDRRILMILPIAAV